MSTDLTIPSPAVSWWMSLPGWARFLLLVALVLGAMKLACGL